MSLMTEAIGQIGRWLDRLARRRDRADDAVKAVLLAMNQTKAYIADWENDKRSRVRERSLVRLWTEAAVAIRRSDPEFAETLQMKAEYWASPENWTSTDVQRAGIGIKRVAAKARALLKSEP